METGYEDGRRSARVVGQDKESGSLWAFSRNFLRRGASFFTAYCDLHSVTVTRVAQVAMTRRITAPHQARRKPFGRSGWPAGRVAAALVLGLAALGAPAALGRLFKLRITLTDSAAPAGIYRLLTDAPVERGELVAVCFHQRSPGRDSRVAISDEAIVRRARSRSRRSSARCRVMTFGSSAARLRLTECGSQTAARRHVTAPDDPCCTLDGAHAELARARCGCSVSMTRGAGMRVTSGRFRSRECTACSGRC